MLNGGGGDLFSGPLETGMQRVSAGCGMCCHMHKYAGECMTTHKNTWKNALCPSVPRLVRLPAPLCFELWHVCECQKSSLATRTGGRERQSFREV